MTLIDCKLTMRHSVAASNRSGMTLSYLSMASSHSIMTSGHLIMASNHLRVTLSHSIMTSSHSGMTSSHKVMAPTHSIMTVSHSEMTSGHIRYTLQRSKSPNIYSKWAKRKLNLAYMHLKSACMLAKLTTIQLKQINTLFRCLKATAKDIALVELFVSRKSTILCRLL